MRILVTGGAGFIGSHIADALIADGHTVKIIDNLSSGKLENLPSKAEFYHQDIHSLSWDGNLLKDVEVVFHEAAIASVPKSIQTPILTQRAGEMATLVLLQAAVKQKVRRVVFAATSAAYGDAESPQVETMLPNPKSPYAVSKIACENYIKAFCHCHGLEGVSLRYFNVFGIRQDPNNPYSGVISIFLKQMHAGLRPTIYGDGLTSRDFCHIDNVVQANLLAMKTDKCKGNVFNVGCGETASLNDLVAELNRSLKTNLEPIYEPERAGDIKKTQADISSARLNLGYNPTVSFAQGIERIINGSNLA